jgi:hypothetical protein
VELCITTLPLIFFVYETFTDVPLIIDTKYILYFCDGTIYNCCVVFIYHNTFALSLFLFIFFLLFSEQTYFLIFFKYFVSFFSLPFVF